MAIVKKTWITFFEDEKRVLDLTQEIAKKGFVALADFFEQETFDELLEYSYSLAYEDNSIIKRAADTPAMNIVRSDEFTKIFDAIHKARCVLEEKVYSPLDPTRFAISMPVKNNSNHSRTGESPFHYDDSYLNAVLAMKLPTNKKEGNLFVYPNLKLIKPLLLAKIISRLLRHSKILRFIFPPKEVSYDVSALHLFFGDVTFHGVPATSHGERRTFTINAESTQCHQ